MAETDAAALRRVGKLAAGVFDLNEDIGSGIDIKMAAPGQKSARTPEVEEPRPAKQPQAKAEKKPDPKPAAPAAKPKAKNPDQPPGMK